MDRMSFLLEGFSVGHTRGQILTDGFISTIAPYSWTQRTTDGAGWMTRTEGTVTWTSRDSSGIGWTKRSNPTTPSS